MTNELAAMQLDRSIAALNAQIRAYYTDKSSEATAPRIPIEPSESIAPAK